MRYSLVVLLSLIGVPAFAASGDDIDLEGLAEILRQRLPSVEAGQITPTPIAGLYEVNLASGVFYVTHDGRYALSGSLIEWDTGRNLTEQALSMGRLSVLETIPESKMIVFESTGEARHTITTFTDIDCPYCRKMHAEMAELNDLGIRVRYMLFPRTGVDSPSYDKAVSVWCATDRQTELTQAKNGVTPPSRECENPVEEHMALAEQLGLRGTPMTITDGGETIMGYVPARDLLDRMDRSKASP